jgi:hypothetical protein
MAMSEQEWMGSSATNYDGTTQSNYGGSKPWYNDATWAGAVTGSVQGIFGYLNEQEKLRGQRSLQQDVMNWKTNMVNEENKRMSTMPLLQRIVRRPNGQKLLTSITGARQ